MSRAMMMMVLLQGGVMLVAVGRAKGLALVLGPEGMGIASTVDQLALTVFALGGVGLPYTGLRLMSRAFGHGPEQFRAVGGRFLKRTLVLTALVLAVGVGVVSAQPALLEARLAAFAAEQRLAVLGAAAPFLCMFLMNALAASGRHAAAVTANLAVTLVLGGAAVVGALAGGLGGLYLATATAGAAVLVAMVLYALGPLGLKPRAAAAGATAEAPGELVRQAACFFALLVANMLTMLFARTEALASLGEAATGRLQALLSIALTVGAVMYPLGNIYLIPLVNRPDPVADKLALTDAFLARSVALLALAAVPVVLFPELLVRLLYASAFAPAAGLLFLFVIWQCGFQLAAAYQQLLIGLDDVVFPAGAAVAAMVASIALLQVTVLPLGLAGVGLSLISGVLLYLAALLARLRLRFHAGPSARVAAQVLMALVLIGAASAAGRLPLGEGWWARGLAVAAIGVWLRFGLSAEVRDFRSWGASTRDDPQRAI